MSEDAHATAFQQPTCKSELPARSARSSVTVVSDPLNSKPFLQHVLPDPETLCILQGEALTGTIAGEHAPKLLSILLRGFGVPRVQEA